MGTSVFDRRRNTTLFWLGSALVTLGVVLHLPMFLMARDQGFVMAGMDMDTSMLLGMAAILCGYALAGYGLLPREPRGARSEAALLTFAAPEDAPLTAAHWRLAVLISLALIIDIMKPASLGFVTPGMRTEYAVEAHTVAWLPFAALAGTVIGSFVWGVLADLYGRRASLLLSAVMYVGTSICGAMPSLWWNVGMCFLMGAAAGGMLPVAYALLAEIMPTRHRGWSLVLVGGVGAVGGYFAASFLSAVLQPLFGWRIMWFLNFPTGLILVALSPLLPESARFLQMMGRESEARAVLARFCSVPTDTLATQGASRASSSPIPSSAFGITAALTLAALAWGLVNFGFLLWLPETLSAHGRSVAAASALIAKSTLLAAPTVVLSAWLFGAWSTKWSLVAAVSLTVAGLLGFLPQAFGSGALAHPLVPLTLVIVGSCGLISILLPYAAESYPLRIRGRATGWVAACSKFGGLLAQTLSVAGFVPPFITAVLVLAGVAAVACVLIAMYGRESRGRDLRELERQPAVAYSPPR